MAQQFDYFKQYVSEQNRIRAKIQEEENPIHRQHLVEIDKMIDDKIKAAVPAMLRQHDKDLQVNVEMDVNGKPVRDGDIMGGIRDAVINAVKKMIKHS